METIRIIQGGQQGWPWYQVMNDLKTKGGLDDVIIDPLSVKKSSCGGSTKKGTHFYITWAHNMFLLVTMSQNETELIDAFSKIVEYKPFCQYEEDTEKKEAPILFTFEWDKVDPEGRFGELQKNKQMKNLKRLEN